MKKYSEEDQRLMASWAMDCAQRVLALFERFAPQDTRPRDAIAVGRAWVEREPVSMAVIRSASLAAHAAARAASPLPEACFAARACGQAVATAHVAQHAYGGAYYALKAIAATDATHALQHVMAELAWQSQALAPHLRDEIIGRIVVEDRRKGLFVSIRKGPGF